MSLNVGAEDSEQIQSVVDNVETVEVVSGTENIVNSPGTDAASKMVASQLSVSSSGMIEIDPHALTCTLVEMASQQLAQGNAMLPSSITTSLPSSVMSVGDNSSLVAGMKRPLVNDSLGDFGDDLPRKKSRNYLDSHKTIEKKRRDRINTGLSLLKDMVPDCRQYGSKKLDKAEIIEFTIQYIKRMHAQTNGRTNSGDNDLAASQREWANDLMTWVFQNKLLYSGPNALEQFCNALLLNLQSIGAPQTAPTTSSSFSPASSNVLFNQGTSGASSDEESIIRGQANLLQQIVSSVGQQGSDSAPATTAGKVENTPNQQQIAQIQALLLLQQQQLLGQHQNTEGSGAANGEENHAHQLQQLQAILLQHIASDSTGQSKPATNEDENMGVAYSNTDATKTANDALMVVSDAVGTTITSGVDLSLSSAITSQGDALDPNPVYSSTSLDDNLLESTSTVRSSTQMWSGQQDSSLLLGDGVQEHSIESDVVEDELLSRTQQNP